MKEILVTITDQGQVTIPAEVRRDLGWEKNQRIVLVIDEEAGTVCLKAPRYPDIASIQGAAGTLDQELSWEETQAIAREDRLAAKLAPQDHA